MSNFTKFLSVFAMLCCSLTSYAQPELLIQPRDADASTGDVVTVDVKMVNFENLSGVTFTLGWNPSILEYQNVTNLNSTLGLIPANGVNFNYALTLSQGKLIFNWNDPSSGVTLTPPDTSLLFSVELELLQPSGNTHFLTFPDDPAPVEILQQIGGIVTDITPLTTVTTGPATEAGYNAPTDPCAGITDISHVLSDETAATGQQVCVDVQACNFVEIEAMQYTIEYNPNILRFDSVTNFGITRLDENSFAHNIPPQIPLGFITFAWPDSAVGGISANNGDILYSLCFTAIGAGGDMDTIEITSSINNIEIVDTSGMVQTFVSSGGMVEVTGSGGGAVTLNADSKTGNPSDNICIDVTATNFSDLLDLEFSMGWDQTVAAFDRIETTTAFSGANSPTFDTSPGLTNAGKLSFDWSNGSTPFDIADGTVLFQVCFDIVGSGGESTSIDFTDDPLTQSGTRDDGMGGTESATVTGTAGNISIIGSGTFQLIAPDTIGSAGDTICVPVSIKGFNELLGVQFELQWNDSVLDLISQNNNLPAQTFEFEKMGGAYFVSWSDAALSGVTLPNDSVIFEFCFELIGMSGDSSFLNFVDVEVGKDSMGSLVNVPYAVTDGKVTIGNFDPLTVSDTTITTIACKGDATGAIDITVMGGESPYTYAWSNSAISEDISGLTAGDYTVTVTDMGGTTITETYTVSEPAAALGYSFAITNVACNGDNNGSIDLTPTGGTSPYTYAWSTTAISEDIGSLAPNTYTVTITDANACTIVADTAITEPAVLNGTLNATNVVCNGDNNGSIDLVPAGGSTPYTYAWNNSAITEDISGLAPATYTVTITDANSCQFIDSVEVTEPQAIVINASSAGPGCNGDSTGTINLTILRGTPPYVDFDWNFDQYDGMQNLAGLKAGTYTVTVTDNAACTAVRTITVNQPALLTVSGTVTDESMPAADDGAIDVTITGGSGPFTYNWTPGVYMGQNISSLPPGQYTVTVVDGNGCDATTNFTVNSADAPDISVTLVTPVDCKGESTGAIDVTISSGTPPYTYQWNDGPMSTTQDISNLPAGTYTLTVTDASMIQGVSQPIVVSEPTDALSVSVASNDPSCGNTTDGNISLTVSGGTGAYTYAWNNSLPAQPNQTGLAAGMYTVTVSDANGCTAIGNATLNAPAAISITAFSVAEVICNGEATGGIDITVANGAAPYTFNWSNSAPTEDLSNVIADDYTVTITDANGCSFVFGPYTVTERAAMSLSSTTVVPARCFGEPTGSIDIEVAGGTPPYTYAWENVDSGTPLGATQDLTNLRGGNHGVTITDSEGCTFTPTPIFVDEPAEITVTNTIRNASALNNDGAISTTVSGGTSPYTFSWDGPGGALPTTKDITDLMPGFYYLTVTDNNGCEKFVDSLRVRGVVTITSQKTNVTCFGGDNGAIDITVTAGVAPYTFTWSDGPEITEDRVNLTAGNYTVTITDALGSELIRSFDIDEAPPMELASVVIQDETGNGCNGSINIQITGGTLPLTYQWNTGNTSEDLLNVCKGDYSVTVIDANGCTLTPGNFVVNPPVFIVASIDASDVSCASSNDGEICISVLGGCEPYTYMLDGGRQVISLEKTHCYDNLPASTYDVKVTDRFGSIINVTADVEDQDPILITIDDVQDNTDPLRQNCNGAIQISVNGGMGQYTYQWSHGRTSEDVTGLCDNIDYGVTVTDANGCTASISGIEVNLGLSIQTDVTNTCFGECDGTIDVGVAGGLPPYSYQWSDGPIDSDRGLLCAGVYTVTITDSDGNVLASNAISVLEPSEEIVITGTITDPSGSSADGAIVINVTGGWGGYTYEWFGPNGPIGTSKNISGLIEGNYTVVVTDRQNCEQTASFNLMGERIIPSIDARNESCPGTNDGRLEASATGGTLPYTFAWSNGVNGFVNGRLAPGTYTVTITDVNGLTGTAEAEVLASLPITITFDDPTSTTFQALVTGGTAPYRFQWNTEDRDSTPIISADCGRSYQVLITDANNCTQFNIGQKDCGPGISECDNVRHVITPNDDGNNDFFLISCEGAPTLKLLIFNRYGQLVFETDNYDQTWTGTNERGNPLPEGGYFYILEYDNTQGEFTQEKGYINIVR